jgi:hypothetical protein
MRDQQNEHGRAHNGDVMPGGTQARRGARRAPRCEHDPGHEGGVDRDVDQAADGADGELAVHASGIGDSRPEGKSG